MSHLFIIRFFSEFQVKRLSKSDVIHDFHPGHKQAKRVSLGRSNVVRISGRIESKKLNKEK